MCSRFSINIDSSELQSAGVQFKDSIKNISLDLLPGQMAPVIVLDKGQLKLTAMKFSLVPHWSAEPKVKFATHNARLESVDSKPTWRQAFLSQHCVVPISFFYESVYEGPEAGHIIKFSSNQTLYAAGIFDFWQDPVDASKSFFSFAILTREPSDFILEHGHDRSPIFLRPETHLKWLQLLNQDPNMMKEQLLSYSYHPELMVQIERALKPGWEKRK